MRHLHHPTPFAANRRWLRHGLFWSLALALMLSAAVASAQSVEIWTRKGGSYAYGRGPSHGGPVLIELGSLKSETVTRQDVQYGGERTFKGISLTTLLDRYKAGKGYDTVLLHFKNRVIVPIPLDGPTLEKLNLFVATEIKVKDTFTANFPSADKVTQWGMVQNRIEFDGNKLVTSSRWHPHVPATAEAEFTPWEFVDSLTGIEFVKSAPYYAQFAVNETGAKDGLGVFKARCQFCHSVQKVGSRRGWDFIEPVAINEWKSPKVLFYHVRYRDPDEVAKGARMPAQPDVQTSEIQALWNWIEALGEEQVKPYKP